MAFYGRDFYGRSKYGGLLQFAMVIDPFEAEAQGFDTVSLTWNEPGGTWSGFRIVRSTAGFPITVDDGEVILDFPPGYLGPTGGAFLDTNRQGGWHYYTAFLWDTGASVWERTASVDVMVPYDFGGTDKVWDALPDYYKQVFDSSADFNQQTYRVNPSIYLNNQQAAPNLQLANYLGVFGWTLDLLRSQAEQVLDGYDVSLVHVNRLALLASQFGADVEESASPSANRSLVRNLSALYLKRGTLDGIRELLSLVTGWDLDVTMGPNIMLSEDQTNFVNPEPQMWDETVKYQVGDWVRYLNNIFEARTTAYGAAQGPPITRVTNTWWDADKFVEPLETYWDPTLAKFVTVPTAGDIGSWQIQGPAGFISGATFIGQGFTDPEDGSINYVNALAFKNTTGTNNADFTLRSVPRYSTSLTSWTRRLVIESGVPVPIPRKQWDPTVRYRAGDMVMYLGSPYDAIGTSTGIVPSDTTAWRRLGYDNRVRMCLSWWSHGPGNGTPGTGGLRENAVVTQFDENGDMIIDTVTDPASYANTFFDTFNDTTVTLTTGRVAAKGTWSANNSGTWGIARDVNGGYAFPPTTGRSYQLAPATVADAKIGITYRYVPAGTRLMGIVFRWSDASNFWIATQTGVFKVVAGAALANPASGAYSYSSFVNGDRMRVELSGTSIKVFKNNVQQGAGATDAFNQTANRHGVQVEA
jgi:hypothetical protein